MLNINTQVGQSIHIGNNATLTLVAYDEFNMTVELLRHSTRLDIDNVPISPVGTRYSIPAGRSVGFLGDVYVHYIGSGRAGVDYAIIGFDAPRNISIRGEWQQNSARQNKKHDASALKRMSTKSLVFYATMAGDTDLEKELCKRLRNSYR